VLVTVAVADLEHAHRRMHGLRKGRRRRGAATGGYIEEWFVSLERTTAFPLKRCSATRR
jgi:hypothetical protein